MSATHKIGGMASLREKDAVYICRRGILGEIRSGGRVVVPHIVIELKYKIGSTAGGGHG